VSEFDFSNLNRDQMRLLDLGGWTADCGRAAPSRRSATELVSRGILEAYTATHEDNHGSYRVTEYHAPQRVQAAWRALQARQEQQCESLEEEP